MSWLFSRALVEGYSEAICLDGEQFAQSNGSPTPQAYLPLDRMTAFSRPSRSGMTFAPLTDTLGAAVLMSFLAAFPAKTLARPALVPDLMESEAGSGQRWCGSFARYDRDTSTWKTPQCSLLEGLDEFSETWPRRGSMRSGVSYLRPTPALPICASASGLWPTPERRWPTPVASMSKGSSPASLTRKTGASHENDRLDHAVMASDGGQLNPTWVEWLMGWPLEWTALEPLATVRFQEWQQQHSPSSLLRQVKAAA